MAGRWRCSPSRDSWCRRTRARAAGFDHRALATTFLVSFVRPGAKAFVDEAGALRSDLEGLCRSPSTAAVSQARTAFARAVLAYVRIELVRFGPNRENNRQERLLLYPDPKGLVRRQVDKAIASHDPSVLDPAKLHGKSVALQGFSALELLLHAEASDQLAAPGEAGHFRCGYALSIGANVERIAREIESGWSQPEGYSRLMLEPSADNPVYFEEKEVTLELFKVFLNGLETLRDVRIAAPVGLRSLDKAPTPGLFETSALTLPCLAASIEGLLSLWRNAGLEQLLARHDRPIAEFVGRELEAALRSLSAIKGDIAAARKPSAVRTGLVALGFPLKNARLTAADIMAEATSSRWGSMPAMAIDRRQLLFGASTTLLMGGVEARAEKSVRFAAAYADGDDRFWRRDLRSRAWPLEPHAAARARSRCDPAPGYARGHRVCPASWSIRDCLRCGRPAAADQDRRRARPAFLRSWCLCGGWQAAAFHRE